MSVRDLSLKLLYRAGLLDRLARKSLARGRFVLMFHGVSSTKRPDLQVSAQPYLDVDDLARILGWLQSRCHLLDAEALLSGSTAGVLLTFDDGYANNHAQALPLLVERSAPAVFFVATQHVAEPRNWLPSIRQEVGEIWSSHDQVPDAIARDLFDGLSVEQLQECAGGEGLEIGCHTMTHPLLTALDEPSLQRELVESRQQLESWIERPVRLFAYPTGEYDRRVLEATRLAGYQAAFAESTRDLSPYRHFEIPRIGFYSSEPWYMAAKLSGLFSRPLPVGSQS